MKKFIRSLVILFVIIGSFYSVYGQKVSIAKYSFLNTSADTLILYGQSDRLFTAFSQKVKQLIKLGNKQISILHLGDSHLQADLSTGQTRKLFQTFLPGITASRGMVTPYTKGCPDSYQVHFSSAWQGANIVHQKNIPQGLWGYTAYTNEKRASIDIKINNRAMVKYDYNVLRIYHSPLRQGDIVLDIESAYQKIEYPDKGYTEFILKDYLDEVVVKIINPLQTNVLIYGFLFENDMAGITYNVVGINGATARSFVDSQNFAPQLSTLNCDLVIVSLGTNDTYDSGSEKSFQTNLSTLISNIRKTKGDIPILLISPTECFYHKNGINPRCESTENIIRMVAKQNDCAYLDIYNIMGGRNSANKMHNNNLMQADRIHLTSKGYTLEGDLIFNAIWDCIEKRF